MVICLHCQDDCHVFICLRQFSFNFSRSRSVYLFEEAKRRVKWVMTLNLWLWNLIHMSIQVRSYWALVSKPQAFFLSFLVNFLIEISLVSFSLSLFLDSMMIIHLPLQNRNPVLYPCFYTLSPKCQSNLKLKGYQFNYNLAQYKTITVVKIKDILNAMCVVCCSGEKWYLVVRT